MRCATSINFWAFDNSAGSSLVEVEGIALGSEGVACTGSQYVVMTQAEFDQATVSPFRLSVADASLLSGAVLLIWALAWGFRMAIRVVREADPASEEM